MSDTDSNSSNVSVGAADDNGGHASISSDVREICNRLRAQRILSSSSDVYEIHPRRSQVEVIEIVKALEENISVNHVRFQLDYFAKIALIAIAKYVESSKTLQKLDLRVSHCYQSEMISVLLRALSRNTSVTQLVIRTDVIGSASVAFQELLTCMQTLQKNGSVRFVSARSIR